MTALQNYAEEKKYDLLSKFESVAEFNNHFEQAMLLHKDKFTKSEYIALNKLRKFAYSENSSSTVGVAWCKAQTCVAATHKDRTLVINDNVSTFGISRSTFDRMLSVASELGIVTVYNQNNKSKSNKRIHNVYVFNRIEEVREESYVLLKKRKVVQLDEVKVTKNEIKMSVSRKENMPETVRIVSKSSTIDVSNVVKIDETITLLLELPRFKDLLTYPQAENVATKKQSNVISFEENKTEYQQIAEKIDGLFVDKKIIYRIYGVWLAQTNKMYNKPPFEVATRAVDVLIGEVKRRISLEIKPLDNPSGYFNGILFNMINRWLENEIKQDWEQAMLNVESTFEQCENYETEIETPQPILSPERLDRATNYLERKKLELVNDASDKYLRRQLRLIKYDDLLSEYMFAYASSLLEETKIIPSTRPSFYNWLDECETEFATG